MKRSEAMSDKNDYWKELFGDDFPDILDQEPEISGEGDDADAKKSADAAQPTGSTPAEEAPIHIDDPGAQ